MYSSARFAKLYKDSLDMLAFSDTAKQRIKQRLLDSAASGSETVTSGGVVSMEKLRAGRYFSRRISLHHVAAAVPCIVLVISLTTTALAASGTLKRMFQLILGGAPQQTGESVLIPVDLKKYKEYSRRSSGVSDIPFAEFPDESSFTDATGIKLTRAGSLSLTNIIFVADEKNHAGHIFMDAAFNGISAKLNSYFILEGYEGEDAGFGDDEYISQETVEYADGKQAVFLVSNAREEILDENGKVVGYGPNSLIVYFDEYGIMYQLITLDTEEGRALAVEVLYAFHGEM